MADAAQQYAATVQGYQDVQQNLAAQAGKTNQAYTQLYNQQGAFGQSQQLALKQQFDRQQAANQQAMLASGLNNTSVLGAGARGINYDYANSLLTLNDQLYQRQNQIKQAQLGYQQNYQTLAAGVGQGLAGFEGAYAQGLLGQQTQYGLAGMQASAQQQQAAQQQQYQMQQMAAAASENQMQARNQFDATSALSAQQAGQQAALQGQQIQAQTAMQGQQLQAQAAQQQAGFEQQDYAAENFGYYRNPCGPRLAASRSGSLWRRRLRSGRRGCFLEHQIDTAPTTAMQ